MKILITGVHGFVGTNLVGYLAKANEIYGKLKQSSLSYSDYIRMKNEVDELYEEKKEDSTSLATEDESSIRK